MLEQQSKVINGVEYQVTQLGALQGRRVLTRIMKAVGPALEGAEKGEAKMLGVLMSQLDEEAVDYLCDVFAKSTTVTIGTKHPVLADIFDAHFAGKYEDLIAWLIFCFTVNFSSFFTGIGGLKGGAAHKV